MNPIGKSLAPRSPDGEPPLKRRKIQSPHCEGQTKSKEPIVLSYELILKILNIISLNGSLLMTELSKGTASYMESRWKDFSEGENLNFDWAECETQNYPEKFRYIQGRGLLDYIESRPYIFTFIEQTAVIYSTSGTCLPVETIYGKAFKCSSQIKRLYESFKKRMLSFPALGVYIWSDLTYLAQLTGKPANFLPEEGHLFESKKDDFRNHFLKNKAGDQLLRGLFYLTQYSKRIFDYLPSQKTYFLRLTDNDHSLYSTAFNCLNQAIIKKATCASYLAIKILAPVKSLPFYSNNLNFMLCEDLAIASIGQGDYRGLEELLNSSFSPNEQLTHHFYSIGRHFPPVIARKASLEANLQLRETLLNQAIEDYGVSIPDGVLINLIETKISLEKGEEAQNLIKQLMKGFSENIWYQKALSRKEAFEAILDIRYDTYNLSDRIWHFKAAADKPEFAAGHYLSNDHLKIELEEISQMNFMMDTALEIFGKTIPLEALIHAGILKMYAKKFDQALSFITQGIDGYGNEPPDFASAALQVIMGVLIPNKEHFDSLKQPISVKVWMEVYRYQSDVAENLEDALFCLQQALNSYGQQVPTNACLYAAELYAAFNDLDESNVWLQKGIAIYQQNNDIDFQDYLNLLIENTERRMGGSCFTEAKNTMDQILSEIIPVIKENAKNPNFLPVKFWDNFLEIHRELQHPILTTIQCYDRQIQGYLLGTLCFYCINKNPTLIVKPYPERENGCYINPNDVAFKLWEVAAVSSAVENWIEQAITAYDNNPPSWIWTTAVKIKRQLNKAAEAERILTTYPEIRREFDLGN